MKIKVLLFGFAFTLSNFAMADWNGKIVNVKTNQVLSREDFVKDVAISNVIVMGEKHYTEEVQKEEGQIISDIVHYAKKENNFSTSWEFLNASSQNETSSLFDQVVAHEISSSQFLLKTQGTPKATVYSPLIDVTAKLGGELFGVNLSRDEKAPVVEKGLGALDPKLLPPDFQLGGKNYSERFTEVMKDHATPEQISNYFAAQSLVDDVSAYHLLEDSDFTLKFLVIGAFHSMYNDGVVSRIKSRSGDNIIVTNIEVIDSSDYDKNEIGQILKDPKYGNRSDYLVFVNEPF